MAEHWGLRLRNSDGEVIIDDEGILQTWQEGRGDNVDSDDPLTVNLFVPSSVRSVRRSLLRFNLLAFRAYETGASSGGDHRHKVFSYMGGAWDDPVPFATTTAGSHNHGITPGSWLAQGTNDPHATQQFEASGGHTHNYNYPLRTMKALKSATDNDFWNVGIGAPAGEDIWTYGSSGSHAHSIVYGIYKSTSATGVTVKINGIDRTAALGGPFNTDQSALDITDYIVPGQWNTMELGSTCLGRLDATVFIQAMMMNTSY